MNKDISDAVAIGDENLKLGPKAKFLKLQLDGIKADSEILEVVDKQTDVITSKIVEDNEKETLQVEPETTDLKTVINKWDIAKKK